MAALAFTGKIGRGTVRCEQMAFDHCGRIIAVFKLVEEGLNAWLMLLKTAVACRLYLLDYMAAKRLARSQQRSLWAGEFKVP